MPKIQILAEAYFLEPNSSNRKHLVLASTPLVRSIIHRLNVPSHPCLSFEDLEGIGLLGLLESIDRYDPGRGASFMSYAYGRIHGAMVDYLRLVDVLPRRRRSAVAGPETGRSGGGFRSGRRAVRRGAGRSHPPPHHEPERSGGPAGGDLNRRRTPPPPTPPGIRRLQSTNQPRPPDPRSRRQGVAGTAIARPRPVNLTRTRRRASNGRR
mgnify:CR=1 FL=1